MFILLNIDSNSGADTWPSALTLTISKENSVPISDLRLWMIRHTPKMYTIAPQGRTFGKEMNDFTFKLLHNQLLEKNLVRLEGFYSDKLFLYYF